MDMKCLQVDGRFTPEVYVGSPEVMGARDVKLKIEKMTEEEKSVIHSPAGEVLLTRDHSLVLRTYPNGGPPSRIHDIAERYLPPQLAGTRSESVYVFRVEDVVRVDRSWLFNHRLLIWDSSGVYSVEIGNSRRADGLMRRLEHLKDPKKDA